MKQPVLGFKPKDLDTKTRPQDDFYQYANGGWIERNSIPKTESWWGSFATLRVNTEKQLHAIVQSLLTAKKGTIGSPEQLIGDFFRSGMDEKRRRALGVKPLDGLREKIRNIGSKKDFLATIATLHHLGVGVVWGAGIDQDAKNSERYLLHFFQEGLGMPDRDYYLKNDTESKRVRDAYVVHVQAMLRLAGYSAKEAQQKVKTILDIETRIAKAWMNKEDRRDIDKTYHKMTVAALKNTAPSVDWSSYLAQIGVKKTGDLIVMQPLFFKEIGVLVDTISLTDWKIYLDWHLVNDFAGFLSPAFVKQSFAFYGTVLSGAKTLKPLWRRTLSTVNGNLGELLGKLYVAKHFGPQAKKRMNALVKDLFVAYENRIKNLDWMSAPTKKKAIAKLHAMNHKIGYPDRWKSYKGLVIKSDDYVGNVMRTALYEHRREMKKLEKPVDRKEWFMYPQTVNAYFSASLNEIVFPAAILQSPFFDLSADDAHNYGCIGTVIGHEMTHGFDDQGAKYDAKGNVNIWWTPEDKKRFDAKTKQLVMQFNQYKVADGIPINGKLTLGENVADLGGLAIALDAYKNHLAKQPSKIIDGFSPLERFFVAFAVFEREICRPEFEKMHALNDPHSPGKFRINGPASNVDEFYETFGVAKSDKLYRTPSARAKIW